MIQKRMDLVTMTLDQLMTQVLEVMDDDEKRKFEELDVNGIVDGPTEKAVKLDCGEFGKTWFPLSQLRTLDGAIYAASWLCAKKRGE